MHKLLRVLHRLCTLLCMSELPTHGVVPAWTLGDRLGKALRIAGVKHEHMAEYLKVSRNTVGNYIGDKVKVPHSTVLAWAMRTGVSMHWLETGEGDPSISPPPGGGEREAADAELRRIAETKRSRRAATRGRDGTPRYLTAA